MGVGLFCSGRLQNQDSLEEVLGTRSLAGTSRLGRKDGSSSGEEASGFFVGFMSLQEPPYAGKQRQLPGLTGLSYETPRNRYPTDAAANYQGGIFSTCGINSLKRNCLAE
jgi:hypothetical protein